MRRIYSNTKYTTCLAVLLVCQAWQSGCIQQWCKQQAPEAHSVEGLRCADTDGIVDHIQLHGHPPIMQDQIYRHFTFFRQNVNKNFFLISLFNWILVYIYISLILCKKTWTIWETKLLIESHHHFKWQFSIDEVLPSSKNLSESFIFCKFLHIGVCYQ